MKTSADLPGEESVPRGNRPGAVGRVDAPLVLEAASVEASPGDLLSDEPVEQVRAVASDRAEVV